MCVGKGFLLSVLLLAPTLAIAGAQTETPRPLVVAHRGASGYLPEHTLEAYTLAVEQGADFIEPDFVASKDGYLFARHENELSATTNVATTFPDRKRKKVIDGREVEGWFSEDLTHDEMKLLRAKERLPFRNQKANQLYQIPTLAEVLGLRASLSREHGRPIGVYPELKYPAYFRSIGLPMEERLVSILEAWALERPGSPVLVQSLDAATVKKLAEMLPAIAAIQLLSADSDVGTPRLVAIASYARGIGIPNTLVIPLGEDGRTTSPTDIVARAHRAGLKVHTYTFRPEAQFLAPDYNGDAAKEYCRFAGLGIDGLFTDTPDLALKAFRESCPMPGAPVR